MIVGVGDMAIATSRDVILSTFALGSCVGVVLFDHKNGIGGLLHVMLPSSSIAAEKSRNQPFFLPTRGLKSLFPSSRQVVWI